MSGLQVPPQSEPLGRWRNYVNVPHGVVVDVKHDLSALDVLHAGRPAQVSESTLRLHEVGVLRKAVLVEGHSGVGQFDEEHGLSMNEPFCLWS